MNNLADIVHFFQERLIKEIKMLEKGTKAPAFSLPDQNGTIHTLKEYKGKKVILYFYSKDMTSGCTKQAVGFAALNDKFNKLNAVVIGISKDTASAHKKFEEKYALPFTLLADPELKTLQDYDVWKEKTMYGKKVFGVVRTTYIIDEKGIIIAAFDKVKADENPQKMLDLLGSI
jgi:peroxiredoxin Q/BCP